MLQTKNNAIAWNPMEAFNFTVANEDCNLYSYDMRKLSVASCVHQVKRPKHLQTFIYPYTVLFLAQPFARASLVFRDLDLLGHLENVCLWPMAKSPLNASTMVAFTGCKMGIICS